MADEDKKDGNLALVPRLRAGGIIQPFCNPFGPFSNPLAYFPNPYQCINNTPYQCTPVLLCKTDPCNSPVIIPVPNTEGFNFQMPQAPAPSAQTSKNKSQSFVLPSMRPVATSSPLQKAPFKPPQVAPAVSQEEVSNRGADIQVEIVPPEEGVKHQATPQDPAKIASAEFQSFNAEELSQSLPTGPSAPLRGAPRGLSTSLPAYRAYPEVVPGQKGWSLHVAPHKFSPAARPLSPAASPGGSPQHSPTASPGGSPQYSPAASLRADSGQFQSFNADDFSHSSQSGGSPGSLGVLPFGAPPGLSTSLPTRTRPQGPPGRRSIHVAPEHFAPAARPLSPPPSPNLPPAPKTPPPARRKWGAPANLGEAMPFQPFAMPSGSSSPYSSESASPSSLSGFSPVSPGSEEPSHLYMESPEIPASPYSFQKEFVNLPYGGTPKTQVSSVPPKAADPRSRRRSLPSKFTNSMFERDTSSYYYGSPVVPPVPSAERPQRVPFRYYDGSPMVPTVPPAGRPQRVPFPGFDMSQSGSPPGVPPVQMLVVTPADEAVRPASPHHSGRREESPFEPVFHSSRLPSRGSPISARSALAPGAAFQIYEDSAPHSPVAAAPGAGFQIYEDSAPRSPAAPGVGFQIYEDSAPRSPAAPGVGFQIYEDSAPRSPVAAVPGGGFQIYEDSAPRSPVAAPGGGFQIFEDSPEDAKLDDVELEVEINPKGPLEHCAVTTRTRTPSQKQLQESAHPGGTNLENVDINVEIAPPDEPSAFADQENLVPGGERAGGGRAFQDLPVERVGDRSHITIRLEESAPEENRGDSYYLSW